MKAIQDGQNILIAGTHLDADDARRTRPELHAYKVIPAQSPELLDGMRIGTIAMTELGFMMLRAEMVHKVIRDKVMSNPFLRGRANFPLDGIECLTAGRRKLFIWL